MMYWRSAGVECDLGFLDLNRDQLFHIDLSIVERPPLLRQQLDQFVLFAVGEQRETGLDPILADNSCASVLNASATPFSSGVR